MTRLRSSCLFLAVAWLAVACGPGDLANSSQSRSPAPSHIDSQAREQPQRLVIIGSYLAEMVVALGAADRVVGVGAGTGHITELSDVPETPGYRITSAENLLALGPTTALFSGRQTRPELIQQLQASGVETHLFPDDLGSIDKVSENILVIGEILGLPQQASALEKQFREDLENALTFVGKASSTPRGLFILSGGGRPTVVAGGDTDIAMLIEMAGARNMTDEISGFKPMSQEKMLEATPEFILINAEGAELSGGIPVAMTAPGVLLTPAGKNRNFITLPSGMLTGLGIETPKAIEMLASMIHPDLSAD